MSAWLAPDLPGPGHCGKRDFVLHILLSFLCLTMFLLKSNSSNMVLFYLICKTRLDIRLNNHIIFRTNSHVDEDLLNLFIQIIEGNVHIKVFLILWLIPTFGIFKVIIFNV